MNWIHSCSPEWLSARRDYLSASDICRLIPITATGMKRTQRAQDEALLKVWAEKQATILESDCISTGAMARGHILEPYAIEAFNKTGVVRLRHWDDILIHDNKGVSFSPDAMDIDQPNDTRAAVHCKEDSVINASTIGEVKSYNAATHYRAGLTHKMTLDERWQIATAFFVCPNLEIANLILYNPNVKHPLFVHRFERAELEDEIEMVFDVAKKYNDFKDSIARATDASCLLSAGDVTCEKDIIAEIETRFSLNP